jgi:uncharacterized protein (DUF1697 family)
MRYVAFLRGVSPQNLRMADLRACLEEAGYTEVRTLLSSGNVAFTTRAGAVSALERRLAREIEQGVGRAFGLTLRSVEQLRRLVDDDPFGEFQVPAGAKRVVSFLSEGRAPPVTLPIDADGVRIHGLVGQEVFTSYLPHPKGPVFMAMLEKAFGKSITTRTWETVRKCAAA